MNELQIHTLLEQANRYRDSDKTLHAIQLLKQIISASPTCDNAYMMLAQMYDETNRPDIAEKILMQGFEVNRENLEYHLLLGNLHLRQLHFKKALAHFVKIRHLNIPQVHLHLGLVFIGLGKFMEAETELKLAAASEPGLPKVYEFLGEVLFEQMKVHEAVDALQHAIHVDPDSGSAHRLLGEAFIHFLQWKPAYDELVLAVDLNTDDSEAWDLCGSVLLQMNRCAEAKKYLERSLHLQPVYPAARAKYKSACAAVGEIEQTFEARTPNEVRQPSVPILTIN